jgi:hypothetical protein
MEFKSSIKGVSTDETIAFREPDGRYKKAIRNGKYAGVIMDSSLGDLSAISFSKLSLWLIGLVFSGDIRCLHNRKIG